jgi:hypothetical protein
MRKKGTGDHHGDYSCYGNRVEFGTESKNSKFAFTISSLHSPLESGSKFAKGAKIGRGSAQKTVTDDGIVAAFHRNESRRDFV